MKQTQFCLCFAWDAIIVIRGRFVILAPARENFDFTVRIPKIIMKSLEFSYIYHFQATLVYSAAGEFVFHSVFPII